MLLDLLCHLELAGCRPLSFGPWRAPELSSKYQAASRLLYSLPKRGRPLGQGLGNQEPPGGTKVEQLDLPRASRASWQNLCRAWSLSDLERLLGSLRKSRCSLAMTVLKQAGAASSCQPSVIPLRDSSGFSLGWPAGMEC